MFWLKGPHQLLDNRESSAKYEGGKDEEQKRYPLLMIYTPSGDVNTNTFSSQERIFFSSFKPPFYTKLMKKHTQHKDF